MSSKKVVAIDLGTTYSALSHVNGHGVPEIVNNSENESTTPSVVYFESENNVVVGKQAKVSAKLYPLRCAALVKRYMGKPNFSFRVDDKSYTPEKISSFTLRKLVADAESVIGEKISDVVITCPAYFGIAERDATKKAGELAGLNVRALLNEPTAAAFAYGIERAGSDQVVLVYDLGGGTFDITMIAVEGGNLRVICTTGVHELGGADFDGRLVTYLMEEFRKKCPDAGDPELDSESLQTLWNDAEDIKKSLTAKEKWPVTVSHGGARARFEVTRAKLEELIQDQIERTVDLTREAIAEGARRGYKNISRILLVGGSSRMPVVARRLGDVFQYPVQMFEPDLAVAKGAALYALKVMVDDEFESFWADGSGSQVGRSDVDQVAGALGIPSERVEGIREMNVQNVCSHGFGVIILDGGKEKVDYPIYMNTPLPAESTKTYYTVENNQRSVKVSVREPLGQVDSPEVELTKEVCIGNLDQLPAGLRAGSPIHVTFRLDGGGLLRVTAVEPQSGRRLDLETKVIGAMSEAEVNQQRQELAAFAVS